MILDEQKSIACVVKMKRKREKENRSKHWKQGNKVRKQAKAKQCDYEREIKMNLK